MSGVLPSYPDSLNAQNLQIWNNAAFDDSGGDEAADGPPTNPISWLPLQPISVNCCRSPDKENRGFPTSPVSLALKPSGPSPLTPYPGKAPAKVKFLLESDTADEEDQTIDQEIESIEREMGRLRARLEVLRIKKAERDSRLAGDSRRGGRVVAARFMDPTQRSCKKPEASPAQRKAEETPARAKARKRAVSLGPSEIRGVLRKLPEPPPTRTPGASARKTRHSLAVAAPTAGASAKKAVESTSAARSGRSVEARRRGLSLGPAEIALASSTSRQIGTTIRKLQNSSREERAGDNRSQSVSPKPKNPAIDARQAVATVGPKKLVKIEETHALEPKTLFQDGNDQEDTQNNKPAVPKKSQPPKNPRSRIVPSRYSLIDTRAYSESKRRKWSLPEKDEEESGVKESAKRSRVSLPVTGDQGKKNKKVAAAAAVETGIAKGPAAADVSPPTPFSATGRLPRIRTSRGGVAETPRDSGPAKRVAELIGRRTHFGHRIEGAEPADDCFQALDFDDADDETCEADREKEQVQLCSVQLISLCS